MKFSIIAALFFVCAVAKTPGSFTPGLSPTVGPAFDCDTNVDRGLSGVKTCLSSSNCPTPINPCMTASCYKTGANLCGICVEAAAVNANCNFNATFCTPVTGTGKCDANGKCQYVFTASNPQPVVCPFGSTCNDQLKTCTTNTCQSGHGSRVRFSSPLGGASSTLNDVAFLGEWTISVGTAVGVDNYPSFPLPIAKGTANDALLVMTNPSSSRPVWQDNGYRYAWGGNGHDEATAVAVNPNTNRIYVAGRTLSTNYPSVNAPSWASCPSATYARSFLAVFDVTQQKAAGAATAAVWTGCWGLSAGSIVISDIGLSINTLDVLFMVGYTTGGSSFPTVGNAYTVNSAAGNQDGFIVKVQTTSGAGASGNPITFATRWGSSSGTESISAIAVRPYSNAGNTHAEFVAVGQCSTPGTIPTTSTKFCTQTSTARVGFVLAGNSALTGTLPQYSSLLCNEWNILDEPAVAVKWGVTGNPSGFDAYISFVSSNIRPEYYVDATPIPPASGLTLTSVTRFRHNSFSAMPVIYNGGVHANLRTPAIAYEIAPTNQDFIHITGTSTSAQHNLRPEVSLNAPLGLTATPQYNDVVYKKFSAQNLHVTSTTTSISARIGGPGNEAPKAIAVFSGSSSILETTVANGGVANIRFPTMVAIVGTQSSGAQFPTMFAKMQPSDFSASSFLTVLDVECLDSGDLNRLKTTVGAKAPLRPLACDETVSRPVKSVGRTRVYLIGDGIDKFSEDAGIYTLGSNNPIGPEGMYEGGQATYLASIISSISKNSDFVLARVQSTMVTYGSGHKTDLLAALTEIEKDVDLFRTYAELPPAIVYYVSTVPIWRANNPTHWDTVNAKAKSLINKGVVIVASSHDVQSNPVYTYYPFMDDHDPWVIDDELENRHKFAIQVGAETYPNIAHARSLIQAQTNRAVFYGPSVHYGVVSSNNSYYSQSTSVGIQRNMQRLNGGGGTETAGAFAVGILSAMMQNKYPERMTQKDAVNYLKYYSTVRLDQATGLPNPWTDTEVNEVVAEYSLRFAGCTPCTDRSDLP